MSFLDLVAVGDPGLQAKFVNATVSTLSRNSMRESSAAVAI